MTSPDAPTLVEVADAIRDRRVSSIAVLEACLAAVDRHGPAINAVTWIDREGARAAARAADARLAAGVPVGPLHGVPLAHKDMYYQAGRPATCGSAILRDHVPDVTATVLRRLEAAGSFAFAGLNMAEFAQNPTGHNAHFGHTRNPWSLDHIPSGSSSGPGAAVAAGLTPASLGSDTGGSVRLPASACGVTGLKPTQTRVSRAGVMPLSFSADNVGPLARTARDCARVLRVIAGVDPADPTASAEPVPDYEAALDGDLRGLRVGIPTNGFLGEGTPVEAAVHAATAVLAARGARLVPIVLPYAAAATAYLIVIMRSEGAAVHERWMRTRAEEYGPSLSGKIYCGYAIPAPLYVEALRARGPILRAFAAEVFGAVDVIAMPTIPAPLPTLAETDVDAGHPGMPAVTEALGVNTRLFNYLGLPAVSMPIGFDPNGLPIGLQIAGRPFAEGRVLKVADAYQRDTDWHARRPSLGKAPPSPDPIRQGANALPGPAST
ncbi:amidase [Muricoccus radiodurans]|uniref:amidase n=1 Tax=Muricoccus radiodurans TaxID=2231721 RepID=UPI003CFB452F